MRQCKELLLILLDFIMEDSCFLKCPYRTEIPAQVVTGEMTCNW